MGSIQSDFLADLVALAPGGVKVRQVPHFANSGTLFYQDADYQTLVAVSYDFQRDTATFNLSAITDAERAAIGARGMGSKPGDPHMTWDGWYAGYVKGDLRIVRDGVAHLLSRRAGPEEAT